MHSDKWTGAAAASEDKFIVDGYPFQFFPKIWPEQGNANDVTLRIKTIRDVILSDDQIRELYQCREHHKTLIIKNATKAASLQYWAAYFGLEMKASISSFMRDLAHRVVKGSRHQECCAFCPDKCCCYLNFLRLLLVCNYSTSEQSSP